MLALLPLKNKSYSMKYQIKNRKQLRGQMSAIKLNLRIQEAQLQQNASAYLSYTAKHILGKNKHPKLPVLVGNILPHFSQGEVLIHILPQFVRRYVMTRSGWISKSIASIFAKKIGKTLDKAYFDAK